MALQAKGPGPIYRWAIVTLDNSGSTAQNFVLSVPYQGLAGSGVLLPDLHGSALFGVSATQAAQILPLDMAGQDAYAITLAAGSQPVIALELAQSSLKTAKLWNRASFDDHAQRYAFLRGANLGIALLTAIALLSFLAVRANPVFPAAALFGLSCVAFLAVEASYVPLAGLWSGQGAAGRIGMLIEGLM
jgi:hypothetical protein